MIVNICNDKIKIIMISKEVQHRCFVCSGLMNSPTKARHQDYQIETGNLNMDHALDSVAAPLKGKCRSLHRELFQFIKSLWHSNTLILGNRMLGFYLFSSCELVLYINNSCATYTIIQ